MIFLSPELWGNYNCSWKLQLWLEKTKALLEKTSLSVTIGPTTVKLVNIELKKTLSNAEKPNVCRQLIFHIKLRFSAIVKEKPKNRDFTFINDFFRI